MCFEIIYSDRLLLLYSYGQTWSLVNLLKIKKLKKDKMVSVYALTIVKYEICIILFLLHLLICMQDVLYPENVHFFYYKTVVKIVFL